MSQPGQLETPAGEGAVCPACGQGFALRPVLLNRSLRCRGCGAPFFVDVAGATHLMVHGAEAPTAEAPAVPGTRRVRRQRQATQRILESMRAQVLAGIARPGAVAGADAAAEAAEPAAAPVVPPRVATDTDRYHASDAPPRRSHTQLAVARMRQAFLAPEPPPPPPADPASGSAGQRHHGRDRVACPGCNSVQPWQESLVDLPLVCSSCQLVFRVLDDGRALPYIANRGAPQDGIGEAVPRPQRSRTQLIRRTRDRLSGVNEELRVLADAAGDIGADEPTTATATAGVRQATTPAPRTAILTHSGENSGRQRRRGWWIATGVLLLALAGLWAGMSQEPDAAAAVRGLSAGLDWRPQRQAAARQTYVGRFLCRQNEPPVLLTAGRSVAIAGTGGWAAGAAADDPWGRSIQASLREPRSGTAWAGHPTAPLPGGTWCLLGGPAARLVLPTGVGVERAWRALVLRLDGHAWRVVAIQAADRDGRYPAPLLPQLPVEP